MMHASLSFLLGLAATSAQTVYSSASVTFVPGSGIAQEGDADIAFRTKLNHNGGNFAGLFTAGSSPKIFYSTAYGSATSQDFMAVTGTGSNYFRFPSDVNGAQGEFRIALLNDNVQEQTETFTVELHHDPMSSAAVKQMDVSATAEGVIQDDEGLTVRLFDSHKVEAQSTSFEFAVELSHAVSEEVEFSYYTSNQQGPHIATAGVDFVSKMGTVTIPASQKRKSFFVQILNDNVQEAIETFEVQLQYAQAYPQMDFMPSNKKFVGTFDEEDEGVRVCVADHHNFAEGSEKFMNFDVTLSHVVDTDFTVHIETVPGSSSGSKIPAEEGFDGVYRKAADVLHFHAGDKAKKFSVEITNDNIQSIHTSPSDKDIFGRVNFGVEYLVSNNVYKGSTGGALNHFGVTSCYSDSQEGKAYGSVYDDEDVTMSLRSVYADTTRTEGDDGWTFVVSLSHKVLGATTQVAAGRGRGADFSLSSYAPQIADTHFATVQEWSSTPCAQKPFTNPANHADACWPEGVFPLHSESHKPERFDQFEKGATRDKQYHFESGSDDHIIEGTEVFGVSLTLGTESRNYGITIPTGKGSSYATILDNEEPSFAFSVSDPSMPEEEDSFFTIGVTLSHESAIDIMLQFETVDDTADQEDYGHGSGQFVWEGRDTNDVFPVTHTLQIPIDNDNIQEPTEEFTVNFYDPHPEGLFEHNIFPEVIKLSITDDEMTSVMVSDMTTPKDESDLEWTFTVTLSHEWSETVHIDIDASLPEQTAEISLVLSAGDTVEVFDLSIQNDDLQEGPPGCTALWEEHVDECVTEFPVRVTEIFDQAGAISSAIYDGVLDRAIHGKGLLIDDEGMTLFIEDSFALEEATHMFFTVHLSHEADFQTNFRYSTSTSEWAPLELDAGAHIAQTTGSQAVGGQDYDAKLLQMAAVSARSTSTVVSINLNNDNVQEETEYVVLVGSAIKFGTSPITLCATADPSEDECITASGALVDAEQVTVMISDRTGAENAANEKWSFTIRMSHTVAEDVTLTYDLLDGTAHFGEDFLPYGMYDSSFDGSFEEADRIGHIVVPAFASTATVDVWVRNDNVQEMDETFRVRLRSQVTPELGIGVFTTPAIGKIRDDENVQVSVHAPPTAVQKTEGSMAFVVTVSHKLSYDVLIDYETADGTAHAGGDYIPMSGQVRLEAGTISTDAAPCDACTIEVILVEDSCQTAPHNSPRYLYVEVERPAGFAAGGANRAAGHILWVDEAPELEIEDSNVEEGDGEMVFRVTLRGCISEPINVGWTVPANGYVVAPSVPPPLTFLANQPGEQTQTFAVSIKNDNIQGPSKTFNARLSTAVANPPSSMGVAIVKQSAVGTIFDNEHVELSITDCISNRNSDGTLDDEFVFTVLLSHELMEPVTIKWQTEDGTALAGDDYISASGTMTFSAYTTTSNQIVVSSISRPDALRPGNAVRFFVNLTEFDVANDDTWADDFLTFGLSQGKGAIAGSETAMLSFYSDPTGVPEGSIHVFTAHLDRTLSTDVHIRYFVTPHPDSSVPVNVAREATEGLDFRRVDGDLEHAATIVFLAGQDVNQTATFEIEIIDDWLVEDTELFDITFEVATDGYKGGVIDVTSQVTSNGHKIIDNDGAELKVTFAQEDDTTGESEGHVFFEVALSHYVYTDVRITLSTSVFSGPGGAGATAGVDYEAVAGQVVTIAGARDSNRTEGGHVQFMRVDIYNDDIQEIPEKFNLHAADIVQFGSGHQRLVNHGSYWTLVESSTGVSTSTPVVVIGEIPDDEGTTLQINSVTGEEGDTFLFSVTLSHEIATPVSLSFRPIGVGAYPAIQGLNFPDAEQTIVFPAGASSPREISVDTEDNDVLQPEVKFQLNHDGSNNMFITQPADQGVGTIKNDDEGAELIVEAHFEEGEAQGVLHVMLTHPANPGFNLAWYTEAGTATAGVDYVDQSGTMTFEAGRSYSTEDLGHSVIFNILNDNLVEPHETIHFHTDLVETTNYGIDLTVDRVVHIEDHEDAVLTIRSSMNWEDAGEMTFTVFLSHGLQGEMQLEYETHTDNEHCLPGADCSAWDTGKPVAGGVGVVDGADFQAVTNGRSKVHVGDEQEGQPFYFTVALFDDYVAEVREHFEVAVTGTVPDLHLSRVDAEHIASGRGTIVDREDATIAIDATTYTSEEAGSVTLEVHLSHRVQPDVTVGFRTYAGTANDHLSLAGSHPFTKDYEEISNGELTFHGAFETGVDTSQIREITVEIVNDDVLEEDEQFCVTLSEDIAPVEISISVPDQVSADGLLGRDGWIVIASDKEFATVSIEDASTADEAGVLRFPVKLSHAVESTDIEVHFRTVTGGAFGSASAADFTEVLDGSVTIPKSAASAQTVYASVSAIDDALSEATETFTVQLTGFGDIVAADPQGVNKPIVPGPLTLAISQVHSSAIGTFVSQAEGDEQALISILDATGVEGGVMTFEVQVTNAMSRDLQVNWVVVNGISTSFGRDVPEASGSFTFPANSQAPRSISITLPDNDVVQPLRQFEVHISLPASPLVKFGKQVAVGTITDNDEAELTIQPATQAERDTSMQFTVTTSHRLEVLTTFGWSTDASGSADADSDFTSVAAGTASVPSNTLSAAGAIQVQLLNDNIQEHDETFTVVGGAISQATGTVTWAQRLATGTITDNEGTTIVVADQERAESAGAFRFVVQLSHNVQSDFTAQYRISDVAFVGNDVSSASAADFIGLVRDGAVTFSPCAGCLPQGEITMAINGDLLKENREAVLIEIISAEAPLTVATGSAFAYINDDDFATLAITGGSLNEAAGSMEFVVTLSHELSVQTTFTYETVSDASPVAGRAWSGNNARYQSDFTAVAGSIFMTAKGDYKFTVPLIDDTVQEHDESLTVRLSGAGLMVGQDFVGHGDLVNDDEGVIASIASVSESEANPFTFVVSFSHAFSQAESFSLVVRSSLSRVPSDTYAVAVAANQPSQRVSVTIATLDDEDAQQDEVFSVDLDYFGRTASQNMVILDDDVPAIGPVAPRLLSVACPSQLTLVATGVSVTVIPGNDLAQVIDVVSCFVDANHDELTFTASGGNALISATMSEAGTMTITSSLFTPAGTQATFVVTASDRTGSASMNVFVTAQSAPRIPLADFVANGITLNVHDTFVAKITNVISSYTDQCDKSMSTVTTDCCNADEMAPTLAALVCQRVAQGQQRANVIESVNVKLQAEHGGSSQLCIGKDSTACGTVTVNVPPTVVGPHNLIFAVQGEVIRYPLAIFGGRSNAFGQYNVQCQGHDSANVNVNYSAGTVTVSNVLAGDGYVVCTVTDDNGAKAVSVATVRVVPRC